MIKSRELLLEGLEGIPGSDGHNLLVVSDLHLGDSLRPTSAGSLKDLARLNRALCRFLKHYARNTVNGRPWRLVIAGDMIDFLHAGLYEPVDGGHERAFNHCSEADAMLWLEAVMRHERRVFRLLASFVGEGHDLVIIKGNHDAQFHFEGVQRRFREVLLELHVRRLLVRRRGLDPSQLAKEMVSFGQRVFFCRWFYYERDLVYIEHGNQYDAFCSFDHVLAPLAPDLSELEDPISHRTYRAFAGFLKSLDLHLVDQWTLFDYVRWVAGLGPKIIGQLAYTYFASIAWMVRAKRSLAMRARQAREEHLRLRQLLTRKFGLPEDILHALDELRERPAGSSLFQGVRMLYMDRVALAIMNLLVVGLAVIAPGPWWLRLISAVAIAGASVGASFWMARLRTVDPHPKLMKMSRKVASLLKVPYVVFGHSHRPVMAEASDGAGETERKSWYFNTGSWTSGHNGLTHVCILRDATLGRAELRRWCIDSHRPLKLKESTV